jgi:uncharacterized protein
MVADAPLGIIELETEVCWDLLRGEEVGRLAVSVDRRPEIFPVNFAVDGRTVVFRTAEGTKFGSLSVDDHVAFEADGFDCATSEAWSVVIKGRAREVRMFDQPDDSTFWLFPWNSTPKSRFVRITPERVSGRRFRVVRRRPPANTLDPRRNL